MVYSLKLFYSWKENINKIIEFLNNFCDFVNSNKILINGPQNNKLSKEDQENGELFVLDSTPL